MSFRVGSLYAGVGGIDKGMKQAGFEIVWANEYDPQACRTYRMNHNPNQLIEGDVYDLDVDNLEPIDILVAGFPCQPFSVAGYRMGFEDDRGNHFNHIMQMVDTLKPQVIFLENVKNFKGHDKGNTYKIVAQEIKTRGYWFKDDILNTAKHGNIPQNRERFFLVAFKDKNKAKNFRFPEEIPLETTIHDFIDDTKVADRYYYTPSSSIYDRIVDDITNKDTVYQWRRKYVRENKSNMCPTLTANMGTGGHNVPIILTSHGIRKLTPIECFRFQGFDDIIFAENTAVSHLYKQAGNSVSVPVIRRIGKNIMFALHGHTREISEVTEPQQLELFNFPF